MRGFSKSCDLDAFKQSGLLDFYQDHKRELFLGIRNNYINIYFQGMNIAKCKPKFKTCQIAAKYCGKEGDYLDVTPDYIIDHYEGIKNRVKEFRSYRVEDAAQQQLILSNNCNRQSDWYCLDAKYLVERPLKRQNLSKNAIFDILAISRKPMDGRYCFALIELKVGTEAYDSFPKQFTKLYRANADQMQKKIRNFTFPESHSRDVRKTIDKEFPASLGSGILGHLYDFECYYRRGHADQTRMEIVKLIDDYKYLGVLEAGDFSQLSMDTLQEKPEIYFLTIGLEKTTITARELMRRCLENGPGSHEFNAEQVLGVKWKNLKIAEERALVEDNFLFTTRKCGEINDILNGHETGLA